MFNYAYVMHRINATLRQLDVFRAVAQNLSFTRAAEQLHLSQPAVSIQVKQLERTLGLPLFEQLGKSLYLTGAGRELLGYARAVIELLEDASVAMDEIKGIQRGKLDISVATTAGSFATRLLAEFSKRFPAITIRLDVTNRKTLLRQLDNNERDLIIMGEPPSEVALQAEAFMANPLVMIAPPDHTLAGRKKIPINHFASEQFVVREQGSGTRAAIMRCFARHGVAFQTGMEMSSNEAIKQAVQAGLGLGIVSQHTIELELQSGALVMLNVEHFPIQRHWYLVHREGKRLSPVAARFREFVLTEPSAVASR